MKSPDKGTLTIELKFAEAAELAKEGGFEIDPEEVSTTGMRIGIQMKAGEYDTQDIAFADAEAFHAQGPIAGILSVMADFLSQEETIMHLMGLVQEKLSESCDCPKCSTKASKPDLAEMAAEGHA